MSLKKIIARAGRLPKGEVTPATFKEFFELQDGVVLWKKNPHGRGNAIPGKPAGCPVFIGGINQGVRITFLSETIKAEVVAYIITFGKYPCGKIVHKDGNRENNNPDNFLLVRRSTPAPVQFAD
jgi:hypothetical protein